MRAVRLFMLGLGLIGLAHGVAAAPAPDPTPAGPYAVRTGEYKLPATKDPLVAPFVATELWARVYLPADPIVEKHPLVVVLHGNHATCGHFVDGVVGRVDDDITYTDTGSCPNGYVVAPSHAGYGYLAETLASWGYAVVSINANRGINAASGIPGDDGLNIRRGRLVLRHLLELARWSAVAGSPKSLGFSLKGQLDFSQIGLVGHSRGGEGMLAAVQIYKDVGSIWPELFASDRAGRQTPRFRAVFEIAPVDGQTARTFSANGLPWSVLLPACDGDVSDLEGMRVFDRALVGRSETDPTLKAAFTVWGANHNFYNTEWQQTDSSGCAGDGNLPLFDGTAAGSPAQRTTGLYPVMALFRGALGASAALPFAGLLDPTFEPPAGLSAITPLQRSYVANVAPRGNLVVDDFSRPIGSGATGPGNMASHLDAFTQGTLSEHDQTLQVGKITWSRPAGLLPSRIFLQSNLAGPAAGKSIDGYATLDFRAGLQCDDSQFGGCPAPSPINAGLNTDFRVALVQADGRLSTALPLSRYTTLIGPVGYGFADFASLHPVLQSVRIPLADFGVKRGTTIRGVRFIFDRTERGAILLANVRFGRPLPRSTDDGGPIVIPLPMATVAADTAPTPKAGARIVGVRNAIETLAEPADRAMPAPQAGGTGSVVEIEIATPTEFKVKDSLPTLQIGSVRLTRSRFSGAGPDRRPVFLVDPARFAALPRNMGAVLRNGSDAWSVGPLGAATPH